MKIDFMQKFNFGKQLFKPALSLLPVIIIPGVLSCERGGGCEKPNVILIMTDDQGY